MFPYVVQKERIVSFSVTNEVVKLSKRRRRSEKEQKRRFRIQMNRRFKRISQINLECVEKVHRLSVFVEITIGGERHVYR